jgi:hypothetical protein
MSFATAEYVCMVPEEGKERNRRGVGKEYRKGKERKRKKRKGMKGKEGKEEKEKERKENEMKGK